MYSLRKRRFTLVTGALLAILLMVAPVVADGHQAAGNLPGGTAIDVSIDDPASSTNYFVLPGDTVDVTVSGTASVGEGVVVKDTTIAYILDRSGSMVLSAGVDCTSDGLNDTFFVCQTEAVRAANAASADPNSAVLQEGVGSYASTGTAHVVDLAPGGTALLVAPDYDGDLNGVHDIVDVAGGLTLLPTGFTCFFCGLEAAATILTGSVTPTNVVLFVSDGFNNEGANVSDFDVNLLPAGTRIESFAMGPNADCDAASPPSRGTLRDVAALGSGDCHEVDDPSELADFIADAVGSQLVSLEISVNGGAPSTIPNADISLPLPQDGPVNVTYSTEVTGLDVGDHEICVTAHGTDAGGAGSVTACITIHVIQQILNGFMTGGGSVFTMDGTRVTHGFTLQCDSDAGPNNLQVNWGRGERFHLEELTSAICFEDPAIDASPPDAPFNTYMGEGTGRYNNVSGATATWYFTDAGEPGVDDVVRLLIEDAGGNVVLQVSGTLNRGNHQAHEKN
jgi:trimeric autotransporter adhesin